MQPQLSSPHIIRSSYGFPLQEQHVLRSPQSKATYQPYNFFHPPANHQESYSASIKHLEARIENVESPGRFKPNSG